MNIEELIGFIEQIINNNPENIKEINNLLANYSSEDYKKYISFNPLNYSRNYIIKNKKFDIILVCWGVGQETIIHDHPQKGCCVKILKGELQEKIYSNSKNLIKINTHKKGDLLYNHNDLGLHSIKNISDFPAISLHVYAPGNYKPDLK